DEIAPCLAVPFAERRVQRDIPSAERALDIHDIALGDAESLGEEPGAGAETGGLEPALLAMEVVEELAPGVGGADADHADVVEKVLQDVRLDPPGRVRGEAHADLRVVPLQ